MIYGNDPDITGFLAHLDSTGKPFQVHPSRLRAHMYGIGVGLGATAHLLEQGFLGEAMDQLKRSIDVFNELVKADFHAATPGLELTLPDEDDRQTALVAFLRGRCDYYVDINTGLIRFEDQAVPAESKPDDGLAGVGAVQ